MPKFTDYTGGHLNFILNKINESIYTEVGTLKITARWSREPLPFEERLQGERKELSIKDKWGDLFDCAWFHFTGTIPAEAAGKHVVLLLDVNGEMCIFDAQGTPVRGLSNAVSEFDFSLGKPGKRVFQLAECAKAGAPIAVWADVGCNDLFGNLCEDGTVKQAVIAVCHDDVRALYYDFEVLLDFQRALPPESAQFHQLLHVLNQAAHALKDFSPEAVQQAREILAPVLEKQGGDPVLKISAIGHAHLDLAWMWPVRESIRKTARTFSTAFGLMERYPDYVFGVSQPQCFLWMKTHYPALYAKIKTQVDAGRLEPQGAMWVEADTNLSGGEALVRQVLHGKRFFKQEFGVEINNLWLPDVFGYSAALPQILRKAGVDYFMTQKLSWSRINKFPFHSFHWQGIDGTAVLTHMLPEDTYNGPAAPRSVQKIAQKYKEKGVSEHCLMLYGIGDGGGGPGAEHLERLARLKNMAGLNPVTQEPARDFFEKWAKDAKKFPRWVGELYLERHQGTFTTQARNKWYNRKMELALRDWEWSSIIGKILTGADYPGERLELIWQEVLLYQFHDILPGSSIKRVYDESVARYQAMLRETNKGIQTNDVALSGVIDTQQMTQPVAVHNSLSWERSEWLKSGETWLKATVPASGYQVYELADVSAENFTQIKATERRLENDLLLVEFAADGSIQSICDKATNREVLAAGQNANRLAVYADPGDAWDFPMDYADYPPRFMALVSAVPQTDGPKAILRQTYRIGHSELIQDIVLTAGSRRLDFKTRLTWRETASMLRTCFPVAIHANEATYDIQFGHIKRPTHQNTSWDLAKDEVPTQKWADISQGDYGVALLNDSKYGYKIKGNTIDLNLLRSVPHSGPRLAKDEDVKPGEPHHVFTDQCDHLFTYALYPHLGDFMKGRVAQAGYELNVPLRVNKIASQAGSLPLQASFIHLDSDNIIVESVKQAEDSEDLIVRLFEAEHRGGRTRLVFGFPVRDAGETNLMEEAWRPLALNDNNSLELTFKPFEIKTLRVVWK